MSMFTLAISYLTTSNLPDNHDGVITHLQPDILECEVKWALGSMTTNKATGRDGIELFQLLLSHFSRVRLCATP